MSDAFIRERGRSVKTGLIQSAYTAWLLGAGGDKYRSWGSFLENFGLVEKTRPPKVDAKRLYSWADSFLNKR
jgi:hypothetical protein